MSRRLWLALAVLLLMLASALPAAAVVGGQPDGDRHPYGALILAPGIGYCSGTLIDEDVVLTAGHCTYFFEAYDLSEVWVTFDAEAAVDENWMPVAGEGAWYVADEWVTHPSYVDAEWPYTADYGLVLLDEAVVGIEPANLPYEGQLTDLIGDHGQTSYRFSIVGYGISNYTKGGGPQAPMVEWTRMMSEQRYLPGKPFNSYDTWFALNSVPSAQHGSGCPGDSGSGVFPAAEGELGDTVLAVHSGGYRVGFDASLCGRVSNLEMRVDIPLVLDWLAAYLD